MESDVNTFDDLCSEPAIKIKEKVISIEHSIDEFSSEYLKAVIEKLERDSRKNVRELGGRLSRFIAKKNSEIMRVAGMYDFDRKYGKTLTIAGTDEVGRGPLAGPIVGAAVILDLNYEKDNSLILGIKDSKKLSPKQREELSLIIREKALYYNISVIDNSLIDERGISWSNNEVLLRSSSNLKFKPDIVISDGYAVRNINIRNYHVIKGDAKSASIACASIIAKVYRDSCMKEYAKLYPNYGFENNMGYGTKEHIEALLKYGPCKIHRRSFLRNICAE